MWRAVARSPLRGKVLTRFRYHRHYFKYIVRYPYGDDATQFRTLHDEHHVRSTWVPKLALIIILFILSSRQESSLAFANKPTHQPTPKARATRTSDGVCCSDLPGYSQPCSVMSWRPLHEKKVAGSEAGISHKRWKSHPTNNISE